MYRFIDFPGEVVRVKINQGEVDFYPKGGEVHLIPPLPAKPWNDKPGTIMPRVERPPGIYEISKVDSDAVGVEIWN